MNKPNLKVIAAHTPERAALRAAIANVEAAKKSLTEAEAASERALEKLSAAYRAKEDAERLYRDVERNSSATPVHDHAGLIAALAGGDDIELPTAPPDRLQEVASQLDAANAERAKWSGALKITENEIKARRAALESAEREVEKAASAVAVSMVDIEKLAEETAANIATLRVVNALAPNSPESARIYALLCEIMSPSDCLRHPAAQRLRDFHSALMLDPDAPLPISKVPPGRLLSTGSEGPAG